MASLVFFVLVAVVSSVDLNDWVDMDTAEEYFSITNEQGDVFDIVFSDEFNKAGRNFADGHDAKWTALSRPDTVNAGLAFYTPEMVTTSNGMLNISTINEPHTWDGWNEKTQQWDTFTRFYKSGMVQGWNKFCFTGGIVELSIQLPSTGTWPGLWPAAWLMGNLGRATYKATTDKVWPWSFDICPKDNEQIGLGFDMNSDRGQKLSKCVEDPGAGLNLRQGRGAPEIDIFEAMAFWGGANGFSSSLQIAPSLPVYLRPYAGQPPGDGQWYQGINYGGATQNQAYYGSDSGDAISASKNMASTSLYTSQHLFRIEWIPGDAGVIRWFLDAEMLFEIPATSLTQAYGGLAGKQMPTEPMYLILNTALSATWSSVCNWPDGMANGQACPAGQTVDPSHCCSVFPAHMLVDWVRVYQNPQDPLQTVGCSPKEFPTAEYIKAHAAAYEPLLPTAPLKPRSALLLLRWLVPALLILGACTAVVWVGILAYLHCCRRDSYQAIN